MKIARLIAALIAISALLCGTDANPQELRAERTVDFSVTEPQKLEAVVGPVRVIEVRFTDLQRAPKGAFIGTDPSELSTTIRAAIEAENPKDVDWVVTFTLEFLDRDGKIIDRARGREGFEGEAKTVRIDHPILRYVVPLIERVRVRLEARLD